MRCPTWTAVFVMAAAWTAGADAGQAEMFYLAESTNCHVLFLTLTDFCSVEQHGLVITAPSLCVPEGCTLQVGGGGKGEVFFPIDGVVAAWIDTTEGRTEICRAQGDLGVGAYGCQTVVTALHRVPPRSCGAFDVESALVANLGTHTAAVRVGFNLCRDAEGNPVLGGEPL